MSFKTYVDYNNDNTVKAIENADNYIKEDIDMRNRTDRAINKATLIYTFDEAGKRTVWEKTLLKRWFNWTTYESLDDDSMANVVENSPSWDYLEV